jgi:hypothetical protein
MIASVAIDVPSVGLSSKRDQRARFATSILHTRPTLVAHVRGAP